MAELLYIDGVPMSAVVDSFSGPTEASVEDYSRTIGDSLEGLTFSKKVEITFTTPPLSATEARSLIGLVRGQAHRWTFNRFNATFATNNFLPYSDDGGVNLVGGTSNATRVFSATQPNSLQVTAAFTPAVATVGFNTNSDLTVSGWAVNAAGSWKHFAMVRKNGVVSSFLDGVSTTSLRHISFVSGASYTGVSFHNRDFATAAAVNTSYQGITIAPYAASTLQITSQATLHNNVPALLKPPFVWVHGTVLDHTSVTGSLGVGPLPFKAFVSDSQIVPCVIDGVLEPGARTLTVKLVQR